MKGSFFRNLESLTCRGLTFIEIVVVGSLLLVCSVPIFYLLGSSSRTQEQSFRKNYAYYVAKRVLEFASAKSNRSGFNSIEVHDEFRSPVRIGSNPISPYFQLFGVDGQPISSENNPKLFKILSKYRLRFTLSRVKEHEANNLLRNGVVEVEWDRVDGFGRSNLTLQTILSDVSRL